MGGRSPLGIDGVAADWRADETGRVVAVRIRVRDDAGKYEGRVFAVASWDRQGRPRMPLEAERWAKAKRGTFLAGNDQAGRCDLASEARIYAERLRADGKNARYADLVETIAAGMARDGIHDMKAANFAARVARWLADLQPNWAFADDYKFARTGGAPLSQATRLKYLTMLRAIVAQAVRGRRLPFDPLAELRRPRIDHKIKPTFTLDELRVIVSDDARQSLDRSRQTTVSAVAAAGGDKAKAARRLKVAVGTVYNRLAMEPREDPWWLLACLLTYTGMRAGEAAHLHWQDVRWHEGHIAVRLREGVAIKGRKERLVPLEPELRELLHPLAKPAGFIIADEGLREAGAVLLSKPRKAPASDYTKGFRRYLGRLGIEPGGRTVHSLRHTFISAKIARKDCNLDRLRKGVGHKDIKTTQGYSECSQLFEREVDGWPDGTLWLRRDVSKANVKAQ